MNRLPLIMSWIATGWLPFLVGLYLGHKQEYLLSIIFYFISVNGFKQTYDYLKQKNIYDYLKGRLVEQEKIIQTKQKEIEWLKKYYDL